MTITERGRRAIVSLILYGILSIKTMLFATDEKGNINKTRFGFLEDRVRYLFLLFYLSKLKNYLLRRIPNKIDQKWETGFDLRVI